MAQGWKRIALLVASAVMVLSIASVIPQSVADTSSGGTITEVRQQLSDLRSQQTELAAQRVASQEKLTAAQNQLASTQQEIAAQRDKISQLSSQVAQIALQQYQDRGMNSTVVLFTSTASTEELLGHMAIAQQVTSTANSLLTDLSLNQAALADLERSEQATVDTISAEQAALVELEAQNQAKVSQTSALLNRLNALAAAAAAAAAAKAAADANAAGTGSGSPVAVDPSTGLVSPMKTYTFTSPFGMRVHPIYGSYKFHDGVDMAAPWGTAITAPANGYVVDYSYAGGYGNQLTIDHGVVAGRHIVTSYSHVSSAEVSVGSTVTTGQLIAKVGSTGASTGNHLHYMVMINGEVSDPAPFLN